jgi:hypothetical protein
MPALTFDQMLSLTQLFERDGVGVEFEARLHGLTRGEAEAFASALLRAGQEPRWRTNTNEAGVVTSRWVCSGYGGPVRVTAFFTDDAPGQAT